MLHSFSFAQSPLASFTLNKTIGCAPLMVNFTNTSNNYNTCMWYFGNTNTSTANNPTTVYTSPGTYTISLVVFGNTGQKDSTTRTITVVDNPVASFNVSQITGCEIDNSFQFTNTSTNAVTYTWDFGDGTSSNLPNPIHTYINAGIYNVKLIATSTYGCQAIEIKNSLITIFSKPTIQFTSNTTSTCDANTTFNFSDNTIGASTWNWTFGDGGTSSIQNPSHQYNATGNYNVSLIVTNTNGCSDTLSQSNFIHIGNNLVPSFTVSDTNGCVPTSVHFNSTTPNSNTWLWDFGDGNTSTLKSPNHTYTTTGPFTITLTVTTNTGCNGSVTKNQFIKLDNRPIPAFSLVQDTGCAPFTIQTINNSTGATNFLWNFGSTTSTLTNPIKTYVNGGSYSISLIALSQNGCADSISISNAVKVYDPEAQFQAMPKIGCPGMTVQFSNNTTQNNIISYLWLFGDGTSSTLQNPSHTYTSIGIYPVTLIVTNAFGCIDTTTKLNYITILDPTTNFILPDTIKICLGDSHTFQDPTAASISWHWDFGDGNNSNSQNGTNLYINPGVYTVTLTTSMAGGCTQTFNPLAIVEVVPYIKKPIDFTLLNACKPYNVQFNCTTPNVVSYQWDFGDGGTSNIVNPIHTYQNAGVYNVSLQLVIGSGCITVIDTIVTVGHLNTASASNYNECLNNNIQFNITNSWDFVSCEWHFGDGTTSSSFAPLHAYNTVGNYNAFVITTDFTNCIDTFYLPQPIITNNASADFNVNNPIACLGSSISFNNLSLYGNSFYWEFGDGTTSTDTFPIHTYQQAGTFTVTLKVYNGGCIRTKTAINYISIIDPQANFIYTTNGMCMPVTITLTSQTPTAVDWHWEFGNGDSSTNSNPVYTFYSLPNDSIKLTITDNYGCTKTIKKKNISYYNASITANNTNGCAPLNVQFTDASNGAISWNWNFGDGTTSTLKNPSHVYNGGTFDIVLIATFPGGCIDTSIYPSFINSYKPTADFYSPTIAGCSPTQISFTNTSSDAIAFEWNFGDGGSSTNVNPSHIYNIPGYYSITLITHSDIGCTDTMTKPQYIFIPGTYTKFDIPITSGCQNTSIGFIDSSINASIYNWNFGDGYTSLTKNPNHVYQDTGAFTVTLITFDTLGCSSSYTFPTPVRIYQNPIASGISTNYSGCSNFTTGFINQSQFASQYIWSFGDGTTSNAQDTTHTYYTGGNYYPELIAITNHGCRDTFNFNTPVNVLQTPNAQLSTSDTLACNPSGVTLTSISTDTINASYHWNSGNGSIVNSAIANVYYSIAGYYYPSLIVTNVNGCSDTTTTAIHILESPIANGIASSYQGCNPLTISFSNLSTGAINYLWNFGNSDTTNTISPAYTYTQPGIFQPQLIAYNNLGCTDTINLNPISVLESPVANFYSNDTMGCKNNPITFTNTSTHLINATYNWDLSINHSTQFEPVVSYPYSGNYDIKLIVTNSNGCSDTLTKPNYINIADSLPPPEDPIMSVSVLSDTKVSITWRNSSANDLKKYKVYRLNVTSGFYDLIFTDNNARSYNSQNYSTYIDTSLTTKTNTYTYKVQTLDYCDNAIDLSLLHASTTINITAQAANQNIYVHWTPYIGCDLNQYELYRTEKPNGSPMLIATLNSTVLSYLDTGLYCPYEYSYQVKATELCSSTFSSWSDTSNATPINILENQHVDVIRSTVVDNHYVLTEWSIPALHPERVASYEIYRSKDNLNFNLIASVPAGITSYSDYNTDVNTGEYYYHILVKNDCSLLGSKSNIGSSIYLQGQLIDRTTYLNWTPYKEWASGVDKYEIEYFNINGQWELIKVVDGNLISTSFDE
ncbi:MAG: PKD domain-containing protein [Bacteroidota bacterium]